MTIAEVNQVIRTLLTEEMARGVKEEDLKTSVANILFGLFQEKKIGFLDLRVGLDLLSLDTDGNLIQIEEENRKVLAKEYQITDLRDSIKKEHENFTDLELDRELIRNMVSLYKEGTISIEKLYEFLWILGYGISTEYLILNDEDRKNHNFTFFKRKA